MSIIVLRPTDSPSGKTKSSLLSMEPSSLPAPELGPTLAPELLVKQKKKKVGLKLLYLAHQLLVQRGFSESLVSLPVGLWAWLCDLWRPGTSTWACTPPSVDFCSSCGGNVGATKDQEAKRS